MGSRSGSIWRFESFMRLLSIISVGFLLLGYLSPLVHPRTLWILPFFGLSYPIIVALSIPFLIYWIVKRSRWIWIYIACLALGYNYHTRLVAIGEVNEVPANAKTSLKVLSNNVQIFDLYHPDADQKFENRDSIIAYVKRIDPDVICFQEFYQKDNPTSFQTRRKILDDFNIGHYHEKLIYKPVGNQHFGVILFSKHLIISKGDVIFNSEDDRNYNFCIFADIVKNKDTFRIYNVHLQSIKMSSIPQSESFSDRAKNAINRLRVAYPKRADQAIEIMEHIRQSPYPVIVCGDFNDTPVSFVYNQFDDMLTDAFLASGSGIGSTYVGKIPAGRIDYIFHSPDLVASGFEIQSHPYSDHRAISCTISKINHGETTE